ncbi:MAG: helix-turn-helix transcriptional regulator [Armatimonas sp.]
MSNALFGRHMRALREQRKISLRAFCLVANIDFAAYGRIERGVAAPPHDEKLGPYCSALGLHVEAPEWREALRLAAISREEIPPGLLSDEEVLRKLPVLFPALEGEPVSDEILDELIGMLRRQ